jgi:hypothetical protein
VDLTGSTAFKAVGFENGTVDPQPAWVRRFRNFYSKFPEFLQNAFRECSMGKQDDEFSLHCPKIWKTVGDEIIFCVRVISIEHIACCVSSFQRALEEYGRSLDGDKVALDVKGSGWTGSFPTQNISLEIHSAGRGTTEEDEYITEDFERGADKEPHLYDFLGRDIDAGFRVARAASADRLVVSAELGYLLAEAAIGGLFVGRFEYGGRDRLKGVINDRPYPMVFVDTERNGKRRQIKTREAFLTGQTEVQALPLKEFLHDFLDEAGLDVPALPVRKSDAPRAAPPSYSRYRKAWDSNVNEAEKRAKSENGSAEASADGSAQLPKTVRKFADSAAQSAIQNLLQTSTSRLIADTIRRSAIMNEDQLKELRGHLSLSEVISDAAKNLGINGPKK